jgi:hypothetical protein
MRHCTAGIHTSLTAVRVLRGGNHGMRELYVTVIEQLKSQRDSDAAVKLWEKIWKAYEASGADGIEAIVEELAESPKTAEEEL